MKSWTCLILKLNLFTVCEKMQPISPSLRRYHLDNVGYISFQLMCDFINVRVNYISGLSALIWTTFANSFSHLLWLQGDDMHRTTAFSRSPRAPTQCVLSIYSSLLKLMVVNWHLDPFFMHMTTLIAYSLYFRLLLLQCQL